MTATTFTRLTTACSLCLLAALTAGCGGQAGEVKPLSDGEIRKLPPLQGSEGIDREAYGKLGYALDWSSFASFDVVNQGKPHRAEILGDLLVISDDTTATSALVTSSGSLKWALQIDNRAARFNGLSRMGGEVVACNESEVVRINAETGQLIGRQPLARLAGTRPLFFGPTMVFGSGSSVVAHSTLLNDQLWSYLFPAPVGTDPIKVGPLMAFFTSRDGSVALLDCDTGTMTGNNRMFADAGAPAAAGDNAVFVASTDQSIWAFDLPSLSRRWQVRTQSPLITSPAYAAGRVMVDVPGVGVVSLSSKDGSQQWISKGLRGELVTVRKGNPIFFDNVTGTASLIDAVRGEVIQQVKLPNVSMLLAESPVEGPLYAISPRGEVSRFVPR